MTLKISVKSYSALMEAISRKWSDRLLDDAQAFAAVLNITPKSRTLKLTISGTLSKCETLRTEMLVVAESRNGRIDRPLSVSVLNLSTTDEEHIPISKTQEKAVISLALEILSDLGTDAHSLTEFLGLEVNWADRTSI